MEVIAPFGPHLVIGDLSDELVSKMNADMDNSITEDILDARGQLVACLDVERNCIDKDIGDQFIAEVKPYVEAYVRMSSVGTATSYSYEMLSLWFNQYSEPDDINAVHKHIGDLSCVFYLTDFDVEPPTEKMQKAFDWQRNGVGRGETVFLSSSTYSGTFCSYTVEAKRGRIVLFPAQLLHMVYPARYLSPRRTGSANFKVDVDYASDTT